MRAVVLAGVTACGFQGHEVAVDGERAIDAPLAVTIDGAKVVDGGLDCPAGTGWMTLAGSQYYISQNNDDETWWQAEATCEGMTGGGRQVHLAVVTSLSEAAAVATHMISPNAWLGFFQPLTAATPSDDWRAVTGGAAYSGDWDNNEPNDYDGNEADHREQFVEINMATQTFNDTAGSGGLHYICECDGLAVDTTGVPPAPSTFRAR